jgi:hypothetical protein
MVGLCRFVIEVEYKVVRRRLGESRVGRLWAGVGKVEGSLIEGRCRGSKAGVGLDGCKVCQKAKNNQKLSVINRKIKIKLKLNNKSNNKNSSSSNKYNR